VVISEGGGGEEAGWRRGARGQSEVVCGLLSLLAEQGEGESVGESVPRERSVGRIGAGIGVRSDRSCDVVLLSAVHLHIYMCMNTHSDSGNITPSMCVAVF